VSLFQLHDMHFHSVNDNTRVRLLTLTTL